ncbi:hypothetical protein HDU79_012049 [Rhizoclosmatium sp. JEL0117]|nr:hypothetical protein HDU79_012049 [Rhizoclosmatium sp. JEL0117]
MITRDYVLKGPKLREIYLSTCFPIEMSVSQGGRSMGHCSDFVQYIYHAGMRISPEFDDETWIQKMQNCPHTTFFHGAYPIEVFFAVPNIRNIWLPNIEQIERFQSWLLPRTHTVLCKVRVICQALEKYLDHHNITTRPILKYVSHSTPDPVEPISSKNLTRNFNTFFHSYGKSGWKHTPEIITCFRWHKDWPTLTVVGDRDANSWGYNSGNPVPHNVRLLQRVDINTLRTLQFQNGIHICPSNNEGYGHYINEARAIGAVLITTDHPPMNEFVKDGVNGILVGHNPPYPEAYRLIEPHFYPSVNVKPFHICEGIKKVLEMSTDDRIEMGRKARQTYEQETREMIENLKLVEKEAIEWLYHGKSGNLNAWTAQRSEVTQSILDQCLIVENI